MIKIYEHDKRFMMMVKLKHKNDKGNRDDKNKIDENDKVNRNDKNKVNKDDKDKVNKHRITKEYYHRIKKIWNSELFDMELRSVFCGAILGI